MKQITSLLVFFPLLIFSQVSIPDANFEAELIAQGIDTDGIVNGQISTVDAEAKTGTLNVNNKSISDLTGIEAFINITQLRFDDNSVSTIDISVLTGLTQIRGANNNLSTINVSSNTNLTQIRLQNNNLGSLDIATNTALRRLYLQNNALPALNTSTNTLLQRLYIQNQGDGTILTSLNVASNNALQILVASNNNISTIDLSTNSALTNLQLVNNNLSTIVLTNNTLLTQLRVQGNNLNAIDLSSNTLLENIRLQNNNIADLDLTNNTSLIEIRCQNNNLTTLNAKNGNNTAITTFISTGNTSLTCIEVDDVAYADANFSKPASAAFATDCSTLSVGSFNSNSFSIYPNPVENNININTTFNIEKITVFDVNGKQITENSNSKSLNISSLKQGVYFVKIKSNSSTVIKKVVKR